MIATRTDVALQVSAYTSDKSALCVADVLRMAKRAEKEVGGLRELSIAELGRVGGGAVVGTTN